MDLQGRVALVTGGRRIGAVVATELARRGIDVSMTYHTSRQAVEEVAGTIRSYGRRAAALRADLANPADCAAIVDATIEAMGRLDFFVHLASVYREVPLADLTVAEWDEALAVEARAAYLCALSAVPHMRAAGGGRIILISDWLPRSGRPRYQGFLTYYVAKAAVIALTEALALELAADGILVNAIAPGPILSPPTLTDEKRRAVEQMTPLGRWGGEASVAKAVMALIETDFMTGETIRLDGGRHLK